MSRCGPTRSPPLCEVPRAYCTSIQWSIKWPRPRQPGERRARRRPATLDTALPNWREGASIYLGKRTLRVLAVRDDDADLPPVLVVEDMDR
jgi:hypothetical protein